MADLERAGFVRTPGKGSHQKYQHPKLSGSLILSGHEGDDAKHYQEKQSESGYSRGNEMRDQDRYLKFVKWEEADGVYVGYCPDLFPWGGVCHGATEETAYRKLRLLVREEVAQLGRKRQSLPRPSTRPMRDAVLV